MKRKLSFLELKHLDRINRKHNTAKYFEMIEFWKITFPNYSDDKINVKALIKGTLTLIKNNRLKAI